MSDPPTLFDIDTGRAHGADPWTSQVAALRVRARSQRRKVLERLFAAGEAGHTDSELGDLIGCRETSAGTRRKELEEMGLVERTTQHRPTRYGNPALVHVITDAGAALLEELHRAEHPSSR